MLNCKSSNVKGDSKGEVQNILREKITQLKLQGKIWTSATGSTNTDSFFKIPVSEIDLISCKPAAH